MKRIFSFIITLAIVLSIVGCNNGTAPKTSSSPVATQTTKPDDAPSATAAIQPSTPVAATRAPQSEESQTPSDQLEVMCAPDSPLVDETMQDPTARYRFGMTRQEVLEQLERDRFEILVNDEYKAYDEDGFYRYKDDTQENYSTIMTEVVTLQLDENDRVKWISVSTDTGDQPTTNDLRRDMTEEEVNKLYGEPIFDASQDDMITLLYKVGDHYIEYNFDLEEDENGPKMDIPPELWNINIAIDSNDLFSGQVMKPI